MPKIDLIDMIITEKNKKNVNSQEDYDLSQEKANELLKNNNFAKQNNTSNTIPEIKAKPKL